VGLMLPTLLLPTLDVTSHEFRHEDDNAEGTTPTCARLTVRTSGALPMRTARQKTTPNEPERAEYSPDEVMQRVGTRE
jgi:hypothetical protein